MTDNEIIKALKCLCGDEIPCKDCAYKSDAFACRRMTAIDTLDLISRQKAEIERLNTENNKNFDKWNILEERTKKRYAELYQEAKSVVRAEAVREFAERLKEFYTGEFITDDCHCAIGVIKQNIDDLVREMVGDIE